MDFDDQIHRQTHFHVERERERERLNSLIRNDMNGGSEYRKPVRLCMHIYDVCTNCRQEREMQPKEENRVNFIVGPCCLGKHSLWSL